MNKNRQQFVLQTSLINFLIFLLISCSNTHPDSPKTGWSKAGLKGKVAESSMISYEAITKEGEVTANKSNIMFSENIVFDSAGYMQEVYTKNYSWLFISFFRKNSNDLLYMTNPMIGNDGGIDTVIYTNGKADSIISKGKDGAISGTTKLILDDEGNIIEKIKRNSRGDLVETTKGVYKNSLLVEETVFDANNKQLRKMEASFNKDNTPKQSRIFTDKDDLFYAKYEYLDPDEQGNWTRRIEYDKAGKAMRVTERALKYFGK